MYVPQPLILIVVIKHLVITDGPHKYSIPTLGYEPAGLTVHPPPQNDQGWVHFFRMGV